MRRYDLITNYRCGSSIEEMERSDDGEWVRWEDVEPLLLAILADRSAYQWHGAIRNVLEPKP